MTTRPPVLDLGYEPIHTRGKPPKWVVAVMVAYGLLLSAAGAVPAWVHREGIREEFLVSVVVAGVLACAWCSLLVVPVTVVRRRPVTRGSLWYPLIGTGLLAGLLIYGVLMAGIEWASGSISDFPWGWGPVVVAAGGWAGWTGVFWAISRTRGPEDVGTRLHRWLLAGSALELLVAVPVHVIVRKREECCAGVASGIGICCGLAVMIVAFGPSVLLLYHRRAKQVRGGGA